MGNLSSKNEGIFEGRNDIFTLKIFSALDKARVPFEIVYSNHGNFFIKAYERKEQSFSYNPYGKGRHVSTVQSMLNMGKLIDDGIVDKADVIAMLEQHYLKHIRFPGYTTNRSKQEITIYSHAPIDLAMLKALALDLNVEFNDDSLLALEHSLDNINAVISQWILRHQFTLNYDRLNNNHKQSKTLSPITQILWNRDYTILDRNHSPEGKPYTVNYVHGHDSEPNVFDLDNLFGKGQHNQVGPYAVHITHR